MNSYTIHHASEGGFYVTALAPHNHSNVVTVVVGGDCAPLICGDLETCLIYVAQKLTDPQPKKRTAK